MNGKQWVNKEHNNKKSEMKEIKQIKNTSKMMNFWLFLLKFCLIFLASLDFLHIHNKYLKQSYFSTQIWPKNLAALFSNFWGFCRAAPPRFLALKIACRAALLGLLAAPTLVAEYNNSTNVYILWFEVSDRKNDLDDMIQF